MAWGVCNPHSCTSFESPPVHSTDASAHSERERTFPAVLKRTSSVSIGVGDCQDVAVL